MTDFAIDNIKQDAALLKDALITVDYYKTTRLVKTCGNYKLNLPRDITATLDLKAGQTVYYYLNKLENTVLLLLHKEPPSHFEKRKLIKRKLTVLGQNSTMYLTLPTQLVKRYAPIKSVSLIHIKAYDELTWHLNVRSFDSN